MEQHGFRLRRAFPHQSLQDGQQHPVQVGQVIVVDGAKVPPHGALHVHGALLPVQAGLPQGRPVFRDIVGRQALHAPRFHLLEPVAPVEAGTAQAQIQLFALGAQDHGREALSTPDGQPGLVHLDPGRPSPRSHGLYVVPQGGGAHPAAQQGQDAGQAPQTDGGHVQVRRQLAEGLRPLAGGHVRRQGLGLKSAARGPVDFGRTKPSVGAPRPLPGLPPIPTRLKQFHRAKGYTEGHDDHRFTSSASCFDLRATD